VDPCDVTRGVFPDERNVSIESPPGVGLGSSTAAAPRRDRGWRTAIARRSSKHRATSSRLVSPVRHAPSISHRPAAERDSSSRSELRIAPFSFGQLKCPTPTISRTVRRRDRRKPGHREGDRSASRRLRIESLGLGHSSCRRRGRHLGGRGRTDPAQITRAIALIIDQDSRIDFSSQCRVSRTLRAFEGTARGLSQDRSVVI